jgi:hypothetical protein
MSEALIESYPDWLPKEQLAARIGMVLSGTFSTYLSRLSGAGLIERSKQGVRINESAMGYRA